MPKVDWITWKTDINEIIDPQKVLENITKKAQEYHVYTNSTIYEGINYEMNKGGLNKNSLIINGNSLAYNQANKILNNLEEIKENIEELKKIVLDSSEEQREIEKRQLIKALETKIEEETKIKNNTITLKNKIQIENELINKDNIEDLINISTERINKLQEKLDKVRAL